MAATADDIAAAGGDPRPTFGLALSRLPDPHWSALTPAGPLRSWHLVRMTDASSPTRSPLVVPERLLHHLVGAGHLDMELAPSTRRVAARHALTGTLRDAAEGTAQAWAEGRVVVLSGPQHGNLTTVAAEAALTAGGRALHVVAAEDLPRAAEDRERFLRLMERESVLEGCAWAMDLGDARQDDVIAATSGVSITTWRCVEYVIIDSSQEAASSAAPGAGCRILEPHSTGGAVRREEAGAVDASPIDVRFRDPLGCPRQAPWLEAAQDVVFEESPAVRPFPVRPGRRVAPGGASTTGRLVAYGSGVMRTQLMLLDRDPAVVALACRPVELVWPEESRVVASCTAADGQASGRQRPVARLRRTRRTLCPAGGAGTGCGGCRQGSGLVLPAPEPPDPVLVANVRWLAGYRYPRYAAGPWMPALVEVFGSPRPAVEAVCELGDPIAVWPAVFHVLWSGVLRVQLDEPLHERAVVSVARQEAGAA
ncbi:TnsA-like heteromeric transposase endonuclease subunit [Streptomyces sp. NPDC006235]|uniref:TnsA-like heteromeric transposase endonuclease subunit n=1 Tax=Streptomyces sp. NPDC006235 TaxID=3156736 RepID=UPI0033A5FD3E